MTQSELYRDLADDLDAYRAECITRGLPMDDARRLEYCSHSLRHKAAAMERANESSRPNGKREIIKGL